MATRQMLARATEGTSAPTPGYLYKDLAVAAQSNPTVCQEMAQYLVQRLQKSNPHVKLKTLKVLSKLCEQVPHFQRTLAHSPHGVSEIKAHVNYRGTPDPVRGDEPNRSIRAAAQEALDAVYRETPTSLRAAGGGGIGAPSASYGAPPHASAGAYPSASSAAGRRMEGIGNPRYSDPRLDPRYNGTVPTTVGEAVREVGEVVLGMIKDPLARNIEVAPSIGGVPNRGFGELPQYQRPSAPPGAAELSRQTQGQWTMASNRGPNAVQPPASSTSSYQRERDYYHNQPPSNGGTSRASVGGVGGSWGSAAPAGGGGPHHSTPSIHITPHPAAAVPSSASHAATVPSDGSYERTLILELCPPSGMKAVPPPDKLANFAKLVPSLNPDLVCPALLDCLEEGQPWIIRAKALCVMETALYGGTRADTGHNPYRDFFHACQDEIVPLAAHPRPAIAGPAKRVLALLGVPVADDGSGGGGGSRPAAAAAAQPAPNLLDFDDDAAAPASETAPPGQAPPPPPSDHQSPSLFGGMQIKSGATAANNGSVPPSSSSLLDFGSPAPAAAPAAAAASSSSSDIFRADANGTATASSLFEQMTLKTASASSTTAHEDKKTDSEDAGDLMVGPASAASGGGSAFGFINASSSKDGGDATASACAPPPPPPTAASFDPLQNFSPTSGKKTMAMSPEQLQAMAYQQMMMQQQMQMQRMMMQTGQPGGMVYPAMMAAPGHPGMVPMPMPMGVVSPGAAVPGMVLPGNHGAAMAGMFRPPPPAKKDDKKFDFVKDAMQTAGKK